MIQNNKVHLTRIPQTSTYAILKDSICVYVCVRESGGAREGQISGKREGERERERERKQRERKQRESERERESEKAERAEREKAERAKERDSFEYCIMFLDFFPNILYTEYSLDLFFLFSCGFSTF